MGLYRAGLYPSFRFFKQLTLSYFQTMLDGRPGCERWRLPGKSREADTPTGSEDPPFGPKQYDAAVLSGVRHGSAKCATIGNDVQRIRGILRDPSYNARPGGNLRDPSRARNIWIGSPTYIATR